MSRLMVLLSLAGLAVPAAASAAEAVTYVYDARGRLVRVVHSGTVNDDVQTAYTLDKAGNRTNVATSGA